MEKEEKKELKKVKQPERANASVGSKGELISTYDRFYLLQVELKDVKLKINSDCYLSCIFFSYNLTPSRISLLWV